MSAAEHIEAARAALRECRQLGDALSAALARAEIALHSALAEALQHPVQTPLEGLPDLTDHRRAHRPGRPARIETDPELGAFIRARIDRMTFCEIAEEVAKAFPENRRVGKSAIHAWWQARNRRR